MCILQDAEEHSLLSEDEVEVDPSQEKAMQHSVLDSMLGGGSGRGAAFEELLTDDAVDTGRATAAEPSDEEEEAEVPAAVVVQLPDHGTNSVPGSTTSITQPREQQLPAERTVFIRGLPLDITQQQLQATMLAFGAVKACRYVKREYQILHIQLIFVYIMKLYDVDDSSFQISGLS